MMQQPHLRSGPPLAHAPLVSVVVPCFNRAHLIASALHSVQEQTLRDWELIVVDDTSTDDLPAVLAGFAGDDRISSIRQPENRGVSAARNRGVANARGRFIAFLDSDDAWFPQKLERQVSAILAASDPERVICVTHTCIVMPGGWSRVRPLSGPSQGENFAEYLYNRGGFAQCSSFMLSRVLAVDTPFREALRQYEDHLFFAELGAKGVQYLMVPQALNIWRNDERADRLGRADDLQRSEAFLQQAGTVLSPKAVHGFRARAQFHLQWQHSRGAALAILLRAWRGGALRFSQVAVLFLRCAIPNSVYQTVRRLRGRMERPAGGSASAASPAQLFGRP